MKKILLIATVLALTLGASSLMASSKWDGLYWEYFNDDTYGNWEGAVYDDPSSDSPYFEGVWIAQDGSGEKGTLYAQLHTGDPGYYRTTTGIIYDEDGNNIGSWSGTFDENANHGQGLAEGVWSLDEANVSGEWLGSITTP